MKYRAEIDGLRALAVVPVILFHAGFEFFSGGFVGVDVFFVISGYLITTILIDDIENKRFSIVRFYERRARRILPALFFVILACIPLSWIWMSPDQMKDFSKSLIAVSLFASNILFWRETGYFSGAAEEKPLLHTWSLAVEEQYYVLFPIFLFLAWRFGKNKVFWMIVVFSAISLALSEWGWRNNATANFYLAPTRAWELFAGSIAAFVIQKRGLQANNTLSILGLAAIIFSVFSYDESTPFPSVYALVPVAGVVFLILFAEKETLVAKLLSTRVFVGIGLISYSAYLWHQPLFAFARIRTAEHPSMILMSVLSLLAIFLAFVSWKFIEQPFRIKNSRYSNRKNIFVFSSIGIFTIVLLGYAGLYTNGAIEIRFSTEQAAVFESVKPSPLRSKCHFPQVENSLNRVACEHFSKTPEFAVFGNSHATELAYALAKVLEPYNASVKQFTMSDCKHNYNVKDEEDSVCQRWHDNVMNNLVADASVKTVILSYRNEAYLQKQKYRKSLVEMTEILLSADKKVILVLQAPLPGAHIDKYLMANLKNVKSKITGISIADWNRLYGSSDRLLNELPRDVIIINPVNYFCEDGECLVANDGIAYYFDDDHMSIGGANIIANALLYKLNFK